MLQTRHTRLLLPLILLAAAPLPGAVAQSGDGAAERAYASANGLLNRGLHDLAADEYRRFLEASPDHPNAPMARYGLGVSLFRLGRYDEAAGELATLRDREAFQFDVEVATVLGQSMVALGRPDDAAPHLAWVIDHRPGHPLADDAAALLAEALYTTGRHDQVARPCSRLVEGAPDSPLRERTELFAGLAEMALGRFEEAAERFTAMRQRFPEGEYAEQTTLLLAQSLHRTRSLAAAVRHYGDIVRRGTEPFLPEALYGLAAILHEQDKDESGARLLDTLLERFPDHPVSADGRLLRGRMAFERGRVDVALALFEALPATGDLGDDALFWQAKCALRAGEPGDAARLLRTALERFPESPLAAEMTYDRAVALVRAGKTVEALAILGGFHEAHARHALAAPALYLTASTLHRADDFRASLAACRRFDRRHAEHELAAPIAFLAIENLFLLEAYEDAATASAAFLARFPDDAESASARFRLGMALYHEDRLDEAQPALRAVVDVDPLAEAFLPAVLALGDLAFQARRWDEAAALLTQYVGATDDDTNDDALLKLGLARHRRDRLDEAIAAYDELLAGHPESAHVPQAHFERGQALIALGRADEAAGAFEAVLVADADGRFAVHARDHLGAIALERGDWEAAAERFASVADGADDADLAARALEQRAAALMTAGRYDDAEGVLAALLEAHPRGEYVGRARAQRAIALARSGDALGALAAIERAERGGLDDIEADLRAAVTYEKAWCLRSTGAPDEAADAYRALLANGGPVDLVRHARLELAELASDAGRHEDAADLLRGLLESPDETEPLDAALASEATYRLAVCEFSRERFPEAATLLDDYLADAPNAEIEPGARLLAGEAHFRSGRFQRAIERLERVVEQSAPDDERAGTALLRLGESFAALQLWAKSETTFGDYLRRFPASDLAYQARFGTGWARENQGRWADAMTEYDQVVDAHAGPTAARAQFQIGQCLFAQKAYEEAARELVRVDILYAYPEWSAAALYEAGRCFEALGSPVEARAQFEKVQREHQGLRWAELAAARLEALARTDLPGHPGR